jgi:hypothetical protein
VIPSAYVRRPTQGAKEVGELEIPAVSVNALPNDVLLVEDNIIIAVVSRVIASSTDAIIGAILRLTGNT